MRGRRRASWWLGGGGLALATALLVIAEPAEVLALVARVRWPALLQGLAATGALVVARGLRLRLLGGDRVRTDGAVGAAAVAQLASAALPLRIGELALLPLLRAAGLPGTVRALSVLVLVRVLDLLALLLWAAVAGAAIGGSPVAAGVALGLLALALVGGWGLGQRGLRRLTRRWRRAGGWRRSTLVQLLRVRYELLRLGRSPVRATATVILSLAVWGAIWVVTLVLLRGMALAWPAMPVLLGVVGAALGSTLPVNFVGNFGSQEAGWAAALAAVGLDPRAALTAGFACHLLSLGFNVVLGAAGAAWLVLTQPGSAASGLLPRLRRLLRSARDP